MLKELQGVMARPKFRPSPDLVHLITEEIQMSVSMVFPKVVEKVVEADPDDTGGIRRRLDKITGK
jgi:hypothetical protein